MPYKDKGEQREYERRWVARRRRQYFADKSCAECGSRVRLQLDHIHPESKISHCIWSWTLSKRNKELAKCQVLCMRCHKKKTSMERSAKMMGEPNYRCRKLPSTSIARIRRLCKSGVTNIGIAKLYGVSKTTISNIRTGKSYIW